MKRLQFYIRHAWRDMSRNGRRTAFALFCIAAGVAAIVALRTLSLIIADSLTANTAEVNHGDILVYPAFRFDPDTDTPQTNTTQRSLPPQTVGVINQWAEQNNVKTTSVIDNQEIQVAPLDNQQNVGRPQFISAYIIDSKVYPFYGPVRAVDPAGVPLSELFSGGNEVVISKNLAESNKIKVGDQVRVSRTTELFTVRGIVPTEIEGSLNNIFAAFFGYAYFDRSSSAVLKLEDTVSLIYMQIPQGADLQALGDSLKAAVPEASIRTTQDIRKQNQQAADVIDRLILVMGLAALLIGGTGIIHTMLVIVGRRTLEIAVLKTIGLKGGQITVMFLVESVIMGFLGSLIGLALGILFSVAVRAFTQSVWPQTLGWRIYPEALMSGLLLGVIVTTVFGFLPTLTAATIRPALVLRPNETKLPAAGCAQIFLAVLLVIVAVGLIAGQLVGNVFIGLAAVAITGVIMLVLVSLLWLLIYVIGILPSFGLVDLRLALRGISTHRMRTASTLLALIAGIFSLSVITLMAESVPRLLNVQLTSAMGGNVMIFGLVPALQRPFIVAQLKDKPGVEHYSEIGTYNGRLVAVNGDRDYVSKLSSRGESFGTFGDREVSRADLIPSALGGVATADVASPGYKPQEVSAGRPLGKEDAGKPNVVMTGTIWSKELGLKPGDAVTVKFGSREVTFTIVGATEAGNGFNMGNFGAFTAPVDAFPVGVSPTFAFTIAKVDEAHLNQTLVNLSSIPGVMPFDLSFFEQLIKRLLSQFTAIPTVVAVLSLFAGAVIIANTVSLSTMERRRQVGVMKAVGLKGWRVLLQMVLENGLIGLIGGLIGVGIGVIATLLLSIGSNMNIMQSVSWGTVAVLLGLSLLISLIATLLSAWTAATEKPINVLRYE
jgi:putative ABC transport system permease protein